MILAIAGWTRPDHQAVALQLNLAPDLFEPTLTDGVANALRFLVAQPQKLQLGFTWLPFQALVHDSK